jgi:hypothetical protein
MMDATASQAPGFRLLVHIGAGKTGTSSIQATLRTSQKVLKQQGTRYLGLNFEHLPHKIHDWQHVRGGEQFHALPMEQGLRELAEVLRRTVAVARQHRFHQGIWSNEQLLARPQPVIAALAAAAAEGLDVRIVAYVRRHDAWARSRYVQWGLSHKTYRGDILPFDDFVKANRPLLNMASLLEPWHDAFGSRLSIRNFDACGDVVDDFLAFAGIDSTNIGKRRTNQTLSNEELVLRALYNSHVDGHSRPVDFVIATGVRSLETAKTPAEWLSALLPRSAALEAIARDTADDRRKLDLWLAEAGQPPMRTDSLAERSADVDPARMMTALTQIVMSLTRKIQAMENAAQKPDGKPSSTGAKAVMQTGAESAEMPAAESPVFVISTGRSGSTLVQRLLNCHPDLVVWGEHFGMLNGIAQAINQMSAPEQKLFPRMPEDNRGPAHLLPTLSDAAAAIEWSNPWSFEEFKDQVRQFIQGYFAGRLAPGQRWGFKEIRYNTMPALRMLADLYPGGKFVFITRAKEDVARSKIAAFVKEKRWRAMSEDERTSNVRALLTEVATHYRLYAAFSARFPARCLTVEFEELLRRPREIVATMLGHLDLASANYDWPLSDEVMGSIITRTRHDEAIAALVHRVAAGMAAAGS